MHEGLLNFVPLISSYPAEYECGDFELETLPPLGPEWTSIGRQLQQRCCTGFSLLRIPRDVDASLRTAANPKQPMASRVEALELIVALYIFDFSRTVRDLLK